jgi:Uma2 family endonuclease
MRLAKTVGRELMRFFGTPLASLALVPPTLAGLEDEVRCREIGISKSVEARRQEPFSAFIDPDARLVNGSGARVYPRAPFHCRDAETSPETPTH